MSNNDAPSISPPESLFPPLSADDATENIYVGSTAGLRNLRQYVPSSHSKNCVSTPLHKDNIDDTRETNLHHIHSSLVTFSTTCEPTVSSPHSFQNVQGQVFITSRRLFFVTMKNANNDFDLAIDSGRISLHAMTSEPRYSVYCQLGCNAGLNSATTFFPGDSGLDRSQDDKGSPGEIHFYPPDDMIDEEKSVFCQGLFDSLSQMASLNPVSDDEDGGGGIVSMMNMMAAAYSDKGGDNEDDMFYRSDQNQMNNAWGALDEHNTEELAPRGATTEERVAMLDRLDNMLTVPAEHGSACNNDENMGATGQFDDADEDDDDLL